VEQPFFDFMHLRSDIFDHVERALLFCLIGPFHALKTNTKHVRLQVGHYYVLVAIIFALACRPNKKVSKTAFGPLTETIIQVHLAEDLQDTLDVTATTYHIVPNSVSKKKKEGIYKSGKYLIKLAINRPCVSVLSIDGKQYKIPVYPSDTSDITIKGYQIQNEEQLFRVHYNGKGSSIYQYFLDKESKLGYFDIRTVKSNFVQSYSTYNRLKEQVDSISQIELDYFNYYVKDHVLPEWFLIEEKNDLIYSGPASNTGRKAYNDFFRTFQDTLDEDYYAYLKYVNIDNKEAIKSSYYYWFLSSYFMKDLDRGEEYEELSLFEKRMRNYISLLKGADGELSGDAQKYFKQYAFSKMIAMFADSSEADSLAKVYKVKDYQHLLSELGTRVTNDNPDLGLVKGDTIPLLLLFDTKEDLRSLKEFGNKITYINIWATWCGPCIKNFPEYNKMVAKYEDDDRVQFINICMRSERDKWKKDILKHELQGINLYASGNWNDKLGSIFSLKGIPHYVLLDEGNILIENFAEKAPYAQAAINNLLQESE